MSLLLLSLASMPLSACSPDEPMGGEEPLFNVSGVWTASLEGTVIVGEDGTGHTTLLTLTMVQTDNTVSGTESFTDDLNRSGSVAISGTLEENVLYVESPDLDPKCVRNVVQIGTVTSTSVGSSLPMAGTASQAGVCPPLNAGVLVYVRQQ